MRISLLTIFCLACLSLAVSALCEELSGESSLKIRSDSMISLQAESSVEFTGNVKATTADYVIHADSVKVYMLKSEKSPEIKKSDGEQKTGRIREIISTGNVRVESGNRKAFADKAVYSALNGTLILTGNAPRVETGESFVTGKIITVYRQDGRVVVEGDGNGQVEAVFNPNDEI